MGKYLDLDDAVANVSGDVARRELEELRAERDDLARSLSGMVEYAECNDPGNPHLDRARVALSMVDREVRSE